MINNVYIKEEEAKRDAKLGTRPNNKAHKLVPLLPFKTFDGATLVACKTQYIQRKCTHCPARVRTYCSCTAGKMLCADCYQEHLLDS